MAGGKRQEAHCELAHQDKTKGQVPMKLHWKRSHLTRTGGTQCLVATLLTVVLHTQAAGQLPPGLETRIESTVRETGVLETVNATEMRCPVPGQATILSLVPEGTVVKKGDLLVELDDAALEDQLSQSKIELAHAVAAVQLAKTELEKVKQQSSLGLSVARQALALASLERERALGKQGALALEILEAESEAEVARLHLANVEQRLAAAEKSNANYGEWQAAAQEMRAKIRLGEARRTFLKGSERQRLELQSELAIVKAEHEVKLQESEQRSLVLTAEAKVRGALAAEQMQERRVAGIERQIESCKILAPRSGTVLHVHPVGGRAAAKPLAAGVTVRERQTLLRLLDLSQWQMRVLVNESKIAKVRVGADVSVSLDAIVDAVFQGTVKRVYTTPEPSSWFDADVKRYAVIVSLDKPPEFARVGLTGFAEIKASRP